MDSKLRYDYLEGSRIVYKGPCRIDKIIVTPDGANASYADVYDGENTSNPKVTRLRVPVTQSILFPFGKDFILQRGLYVAFGTNLSSVTVIGEPVD